MDANSSVDMIVSSVKKSNLNFYLQESPFSLIINLRKSFIKNINGNIVLPQNTLNKNEPSEEGRVKVEKFELEHSALGQLQVELRESQDAVRELSVQLEKAKKENVKSLLELNETAKETEKARNENKTLKIKIDELKLANETLLSDKNVASKELKSKGKEVIGLEKKTMNLEDQLSLKKNENRSLIEERKKIQNEKNKLDKQLLAAKMPIVKNTSTASIASQTSPSTSSSVSRASQTNSLPEISNVDAETIECVVCNKAFSDANSLQVHAEVEHQLILNAQILTDYEEEDAFVRFVKSMEVGKEYIEERIKFYPPHWDHLGERVKIRKLAKMKLAITSSRIEENMKKNDVKKIRYYGWSNVV